MEIEACGYEYDEMTKECIFNHEKGRFSQIHEQMEQNLCHLLKGYPMQEWGNVKK